MRDEATEAEDASAGLALDPFGFFRNAASRVLGLGGNAPGPDPAYAFHTPYVASARGPAHFVVRFQNLQARRGTLVLRVHMLPDERGAAAQLVNSTRIQLNRLIQNGGVAEIDFEGYRGFTFALLGQIPDETDARADGLTITLDRPVDATEEHAPADDIRTTQFRSEALLPTPQLLSMEPPLLAAPVSQACTAEQMAEPVWIERCRELNLSVAPNPDRWPGLFALEVLRRYGLLEAGARGLLLDCENRLGDVMRSAPEAPALESDAGSSGAFDYLCSADALASTIKDPLALIEAALGKLRPGGLAIIFLPLAANSPGSTPGPGLDRSVVERLALTLVSRRHEVAQIKPSGTHRRDSHGIIAFALVVRRGRSPL